jgi:hypothetical protein
MENIVHHLVIGISESLDELVANQITEMDY